MAPKLSPQALAHRLMTFADEAAITKFLAEQLVAFDEPNEQGCTLLITACAFDRAELLPLLVAKTTNYAAATHGNLNNVLHFAALSPHPTVLSTLLAANSAAFSRLLNTGNANGDTPLMVACTAKHVDGALALLGSGADPMAANRSGITALMCAARLEENENDNTEASSRTLVTRLLRALDVSALNAVNSTGQSALHFAVQSRNTAVILALLTAGINIGLRTKDGYTALEIAQAAPYFDADALLAMEVAWGTLEAQLEADLLALANDEIAAAPKASKKKKKAVKKAAKATPAATDAKVATPITSSVRPAATGPARTNMPVTTTQLSAPAKDTASTTMPSAGAWTTVPSKVRVASPMQAKASPMKASTDDCAECSHLGNVLQARFPMFDEMEITVRNFVIDDIEQLSMSQLELLQDAHLQAYQLLNDKKMEIARRLEGERVQAQYELQHQVLRRVNS
ncbi:hypothetical protein SDRG_14153 [Saprolegnia diclina VS20]|uniref:Uncharacterized protein n=1 Tax=Saprolegnia diclina (strain VS20) TaxID=1156394 RepID=T0PRE5_SAPDV|nr:hypothetical protein SDRG_14153 [Saprolegnia diclina VS20]EQC28059.1 hypothetical protein SDRG_14153 [Saprolegnia diclina VS20]|eukprot:XP_008618484.1 hypothetical protein SDRG_14153 [Saprolegnia diclina VS20]